MCADWGRGPNLQPCALDQESNPRPFSAQFDALTSEPPARAQLLLSVTAVTLKSPMSLPLTPSPDALEPGEASGSIQPFPQERGENTQCSEASPYEEGSQQLGKLRQGGQIPTWGLVTPYPCLRTWPWPRNMGRRWQGSSLVALTSLHQPPGPPPGFTAPTLLGSLFSGLREDISERGRQGLVQVPHLHSEPSASVGCWAGLC